MFKEIMPDGSEREINWVRFRVNVPGQEFNSIGSFDGCCDVEVKESSYEDCLYLIGDSSKRSPIEFLNISEWAGEIWAVGNHIGAKSLLSTVRGMRYAAGMFMRNCPACFRAINPAYKFCPHCGVSLIQDTRGIKEKEDKV